MDRGDKNSRAGDGRPRRHSVDLQGWALRGATEFPCRVSDLSLEGCCLSGYFSVGEFIRIRIEKIGTFDAQIRWAVMEKAGARFVERGSGQKPESVVRDEKGATAIEYGFVAALIALSLLAALTETGRGVARRFSFIGAVLPDYSDCIAAHGQRAGEAVDCRT